MTNTTTYKKLWAALLSGCFFMYACENDMTVVREMGNRKAGVDEGKNIDSYLSVNGKMKAHLTAPLVLRYQGDSASKAEFPNSLHVDFYSDSAGTQKESELRADYGRFLENEKKVYLRGNVVAFNFKGDTLFCPELHWDQNTGKFYTDKRVVFSKAYRSNLFIGEKGMTCEQDFSMVTLFESHQGYFTMPDSTAGASPSPDTAKIKK